MKVIVFFFLAFGFAAAMPMAEKFGFKNLYVAPNIPITGRALPRIIGGQEAEPHSIPYQAFIIAWNFSSSFYCGGSLISETRVLTSGNCGKKALAMDVVLGAHKPLQAEETQVTVASIGIVVHPEFDLDTIANDVAVIKLNGAVVLNDAIQLVTLASDPSESYEGATATVSGWGSTAGLGHSPSDVLNTLNSTVISNEECLSYFDIIQDSNICITGDQNTGTCNGDSGGPLTVDGVQIGIVSFGIKYCREGYPSAFARVTSFLDFINSNL